MHDLILLPFIALTTYRLTRFVTADKISEDFFEAIRWRFEQRWIVKHYPRDVPDAVIDSDEWNSKLAYMLSCVWCLGFWVACVVTVLVSIVYGLSHPLLTWLASASLVGLLGRLDSD